MDKAEFIDALRQIKKEKGIDEEIIFEAIETSLVSACKKNFGTSQNIKVEINRETGAVDVFAQKDVVEEVEDNMLQISIEDAQKINKKFKLGDVYNEVVTPKDFGRISAQTAKQVVVQKFREAEREILYNQYITKEKDIVTGIVQRMEKRNVIIQLGKIDAVLAQNEQIPGEEYAFADRIKVYIVEVKQTTKGPQIYVSRTHPELVKRLFEQEVPEVHDGTVEIKSIAREAGSRTKIAVYSKDPNIDAVGACVGQNGYRVNVIVSELHGEKIDIINWSEDPKEFIAAALSPSKVVAVKVNADNQSAKIVVPDHQLSLAIGKEGQNARLSAKLTGWRIDIKSEIQAAETGFLDDDQVVDIVEEVAETDTISLDEE
ncbi:MAG TPA: transcription termination/antitermination protein NusA [Lachnospiraceae bacterium]|nr:transcription termination/antitermination protein NusA [Lachnospiraceae bacterium]